MSQHRMKRIHATSIGGRGVTAASRTFNPVGVGSNPSDLMEEEVRDQRPDVRDLKKASLTSDL